LLRDDTHVVVRLVRSCDGEAKVLGLLSGEGGELDVELGAMSAGDLLIERFGQHAVRVVISNRSY